MVVGGEGVRIMTMSPLKLIPVGGKPCSRGTHNETVKRLPLFFAVINGIVIESHPIAQSCGGIFNSSIKSKICF